MYRIISLFFVLLLSSGALPVNAEEDLPVSSTELGDESVAISTAQTTIMEERGKEPVLGEDVSTTEMSSKTGAYLGNAFEQSEKSPRVSEVSNWPVVILALLGIVALIVGLAWMVRRVGGLNAMGMRGMKIVAVLPLGTREKLALVDVKGQQLLIGVTAQNISLLHTFDQPVITEDDSPTDFAKKLQGLLARQTSAQDHE